MGALGDRPWKFAHACSMRPCDNAGHFSFMFLLIIWIKKTYSGVLFLFLSRSYVHYFNYILVYFSGRKHALRKTPHLPNYISVTPLLQCILEDSLAYIHGNVFGTTDKSIRRILQPEKCLTQRRTLQITLRQLEKRTSSRTTDRAMLFYVELRRQCQPLTFRAMPARNVPYSTSDAT